ncbi:MAG: hypothetical protein H0X36_10710 [Sphingomonadaceae bacterium]|nr:hypothetical protein [Sphingomonadaceae bacterium]
MSYGLGKLAYAIAGLFAQTIGSIWVLVRSWRRRNDRSKAALLIEAGVDIATLATGLALFLLALAFIRGLEPNAAFWIAIVGLVVASIVLFGNRQAPLASLYHKAGL